MHSSRIIRTNSRATGVNVHVEKDRDFSSAEKITNTGALVILYLEAEDISTIILIVDILDDSMQYGGRNAVVFFQGIIFFSIV